MARARRPRFKGHCMLCAMNTDGMVRGFGWTTRAKHAEKRMVGQNKRLTRKAIPVEYRNEIPGR